MNANRLFARLGVALVFLLTMACDLVGCEGDRPNDLITLEYSLYDREP